MSRSSVAFPVPLEFGIQEVGLRSHPGLPALVSSLHGSLNWRAEPSYALKCSSICLKYCTVYVLYGIYCTVCKHEYNTVSTRTSASACTSIDTRTIVLSVYWS